ncbi:hypothetical protein V1514DRAFT_11843 [Lipomyces japonicus]|uniref:uncharacterized protein n=1 Tax=Lipomyces japonicus TaxID=56871 RepID=UPI0034CE67E5
MIKTETKQELLGHSRAATAEAIATREEFTTVVSNRRRRRAQSSKYKRPVPTPSTYASSIPGRIKLLQSSRFYESLIDHVESAICRINENDDQATSPVIVSRIRCLALGRPSESETSLFQTALLLALAAKLNINLQNVTLWDPDFQADDVEILHLLGLSVTQNDGETGKLLRPTAEQVANRQNTLYYMPHAPIFLVDRIIGLGGVRFVLGNDVLGYKERLEEEVDLVFANLRAAIKECGTHEENKSEKSIQWRRVRIEDSLSRDEVWWLSVNDLAMHWHGF